MKMIITLTAVSLVLMGCSSIPGKMSQMRAGMSEDEAIKLLGMPDTASGDAGGHSDFYDCVVSFGVREWYYVHVNGDTVDSYGRAPVSQNSNQVAAAMLMNQNFQQQQMAQQQNYQLQQRILQPQPAMVNCTSNRVGAMTYTNCR